MHIYYARNLTGGAKQRSNLVTDEQIRWKPRTVASHFLPLLRTKEWIARNAHRIRGAPGGEMRHEAGTRENCGDVLNCISAPGNQRSKV